MSNSVKMLTFAAATSLLASSADAVVTERLKQACRDEYFTYCSAHAVGSASLRKCMRASQYRFSDRCLRELVAAGAQSARDSLVSSTKSWTGGGSSRAAVGIRGLRASESVSQGHERNSATH
jgi:hypothetical protein